MVSKVWTFLHNFTQTTKRLCQKGGNLTFDMSCLFYSKFNAIFLAGETCVVLKHTQQEFGVSNQEVYVHLFQFLSALLARFYLYLAF